MQFLIENIYPKSYYLRLNMLWNEGMDVYSRSLPFSSFQYGSKKLRINLSKPKCSTLCPLILQSLYYFFWDKMKCKSVSKLFNNSFKSEEELKKKIKEVWNDDTSDVPNIWRSIKQFFGRLNAVKTKNGRSKVIFADNFFLWNGVFFKKFKNFY